MSHPSDSNSTPRPADSPSPSQPVGDAEVREVQPHEAPPQETSVEQKVINFLVGKPLDLADHSIHHQIALAAFLAWVGLGADGLSSACYGPAEAFAHLYHHASDGHPALDLTYLSIFLGLATVLTVGIISLCYGYIIEAFPGGGGGYLVASKMLGSRVGALSGCALVVDYVLTVTVSIASAGDFLFALLGLSAAGSGISPDTLQSLKLWTESGLIVLLVLLNLRGVKESVTILMPIFLTFLVTHVIVIGGVLFFHTGDISSVAVEVTHKTSQDIGSLGLLAVLGMFLKAYSLGAGTYTGIEAVSNSMAVMREPRVATGQRTMIYMAISLSLAAGGLMLAYLVYDLELKNNGSSLIAVAEAGGGRPFNDLLTDWFAGPSALGQGFRWITVMSAALLLVVAAQAGFIGGPRCLANMARDSWVPHWFGSLSERLAAHNGILLIGFSAILALWANEGKTGLLVILYSINVFLTFTLSMAGMVLYCREQRSKLPGWKWKMAMYLFGTVLCGGILAITVIFKFLDGAWKTVVVTGLMFLLCLAIRRYYFNVTRRLKSLDESLSTIAAAGEPTKAAPDRNAPTAAILVGGYSGIGVHTLLNSVRFVPKHFKNLIFISVGVVDTGNFKGPEGMEDLKEFTDKSLRQYVELARRLGFPSTSYMSIGTDVVDELEQVCRVVHEDFPQCVVFAGQLVFQRDTWYGHFLHNQTAYSLQRRLQWDGIPMVILPTRVRA